MQNHCFNIDKFHQLESTNTKLKSELREREEFDLIVTEDQTIGRGQVGNFWESKKGENLTFSFLLEPKFLLAENQFFISQIVSLGVIDYYSQIDSHFTIKWPNDIYFKDTKVGGILIENTVQQSSLGYSIVGIGLNINQEIFASDAPNPNSLKLITGNQFDLDKVLNSVLFYIEKRYNQLKEGSYNLINEDYFNKLFRADGMYTFEDANGRFKASISGIGAFGFLQLTDSEGENRSYAFKEVSFVL